MRGELVFLTGATGFIGSHVARALSEAGYRVRGLVRAADSKLAPHGCAEIADGDLYRPGELASAMRGCRYLVHCAALYSFAPIDRKHIAQVNVKGTAGLLEAARVAGVERAVVTSSSATVGPARNGSPANEENTAHGRGGSTYHRSKIDQEQAAIAARVPAVLVLPTTPVGPGDWKPTPTGKLVLDFARGRIPARPSQGGFNMVAVEDVAKAHVAALRVGKPRERYIVGGENLLFDEVWELLSAATKRPAPRWRIPYSVTLAVAYADELRCQVTGSRKPVVPLEGVRMSRERMFVDSAKAMRELGHRPTPVRDALARAVAWYRSHGYL